MPTRTTPWTVLALAGLCAAALTSGPARAGEEESIQITKEDVTRDALPLQAVQAHVERLVSLGSRMPGTPGHAAARQYILKTLLDLGYPDGTPDATRDRKRTIVEATEVTPAATEEAGQSFAPGGGAPVPPGGFANVRILLTDEGEEGNTQTGGIVVVRGVDRQGEEAEEVLRLPASKLGRAVVAGDRAFRSVTSVVLKQLTGALKGVNLSAEFGSRYAVGTQRFWGTAPHDPGDGTLTFKAGPPTPGAKAEYPLYGYRPNEAALATTGKEGLSGPLVYGGTGQPEDFDGLPVADAIVLLEVRENTSWTLAAGMGAKAVIFIEPEEALRPNLELLYSLTPVEFPRFWLPREAGLAAKEAVKRSPRKEYPQVTARVRMSWKTEQWENVYLLIPGSGKFDTPPKDAKEEAEVRASTVVLAAYYDSTSVVPARAPGAEQALGCAALLELAKKYKTDPPARDMLLLFTTGHFMALKGEREFFGEAERYGEKDVEILPDSLPELDPGKPVDLRRMLLNARIRSHVLEQLLTRQNFKIERPELETATQQAVQANQAEGTEVQKLVDQAAKKAGKTSWNGVLFLLLFVMFGLYWWIEGVVARQVLFGVATAVVLAFSVVVWLKPELTPGIGWYKAAGAVLYYVVLPNLLVPGAFGLAAVLRPHVSRGLLAGLSWAVSLVIFLYSVLLPFVLQYLQSKEEAASVKGQLDGLLARWKDECSTQEMELERECRIRRNEIQALAANATDEAKRLTQEMGQITAVRDEFKDAGLALYALTSDGARLGLPPNLEQLRGRLLETGQVLRAALKEEEQWAAQERARREWNAECQELLRERVGRVGNRKCLFVSLDLSAGNPGLGTFYKGVFYNQPGDIEARYKGTWGRQVMPIAKAVEKAVGAKEAGTLMPDTLVESGKRSWSTYQGCPLAVAAEVAIQAQIRGITLATPYDRRMCWNTPQDDGRRLAWHNVEVQLKLLGPYLRCLAAQTAVTQEARFEEKMRHTGFSQVIYRAVRPGGSRSIFPNVPVPSAIVHQVVDEWGLAAGGVQLCAVEATNAVGLARITGVMRERPWAPSIKIEIYGYDAETGEINYAVNKPKCGRDENRSFETWLGIRSRQETIELFRAQGLAALDVVDPGRLVPLRNCTILAGRTESKPLEYGSSHTTWQLRDSHRVLFAEPGSRIKLLFREGQLGLRLAVLDVRDDDVKRLLNPATAKEVTDQEARGRGFRLGTRKVIPWLPLRTATDLWCLGEKRIENLRTHSIGNARLDNPAYPGKYSVGTATVTPGQTIVKGQGVEWDRHVAGLPFRVLGRSEWYSVKELQGADELLLERPYAGEAAANMPFVLTREKPGLHNLTRQRLEDALAAKGTERYGTAWQLATEAWGIESRAYPEVLGTANDSVLGVVFYLFLLLPFCFFLERLLFALPKIEHQILAFFLIFVSMFGLLWLVHPAFELVKAPPVILLAFIIMSLAAIVIAIVYSKFNTEMRLMQQGVRGVQSAEVNRASAVLVAVSLGISQMRRRKVRTLLTCITVVLLTFIALSFTSTVRTISQAHIDLSPGDERDAPYTGILLRQLNYDQLRDEAYEQLLRETAGREVVCAPRYWLVAQKDQQLFVDVLGRSEAEVRQNDLRASPSCLLGLSPDESRIHPKVKESVVVGSWLAPGERDVCLLSLRLIKDVLKMDPQTAIGTKLKIGSYEVTLKGIFDSEKFSEIKDLDGEQLTPADFSASAAAFGADQGQQKQQATVENLESAATVKYVHVDPADSVIVPWQLSELLNATLRSVSVRVPDQTEADKSFLTYLVDRVLQRLEKNLYVGQDGRRQFYASTGKMSLAGLGNLVVPLLISVLILLNTMIGAVYERGREITIFSSLGLAPSHIAALFLAEALVYATLGAILGYLLGQGVAKIIQMMQVSGLYLNYSSSSAVFVTAIVMLAVLGSTIYPAMLAARAAAPSEERSWGVPEPVGDEISLEMPFSFQRDLVPGVALFLHEYFDSHSESTLGKFTAKEVTLEAFSTERGEGICLFFMAWLTPYDLGVSQEVQVYIIPETENLYVTEATFYRVSGYVNSWRRVNLPFLNALRKHFLIWRTYSAEQRQEYAVRGYFNFIEAFEAVGWPPPEGAEAPEAFVKAELDEEGLAIGDLPPRPSPA